MKELKNVIINYNLNKQMKQFLLTLILLLFINTTFSQNLVLNPSFEEGENLSTKHSFGLGSANVWDFVISPSFHFHKKARNNGYFGPLDFHKKAFDLGYTVPFNFIGKQYPRTGDAYIAIQPYNPRYNTDGIANVIIEGELTRKLKRGYKYYVEFYVSRSDIYKTTTSSLWMSCSEKHYRTTDTSAYYNEIPKYFVNPKDNYITETDGWQKISGTFFAKGNEKYIAIGSSPTISTLKGKGIVFFYIDDVFVKEIKDSLVIEKGKPLILENIVFESAKAKLLPESNAELEKLLNYLLLNEKSKLEISGHTDNTGDEAKNVLLSEERAKSVIKYLTNQGISENRLLFKGYGSSKPLNTNKTVEGRAKNRRVEVIIIDEKD